MRRRAEQVDQTRARITEAAVRLHTSIGPANTSIAAIAEEAGVTRLTVYRHFADLGEVFVACTAHWVAHNPPPDASRWAAIDDLEQRAHHAFTELYGWYREHADELHPINRDAEAMPASAQQAAEAGNQGLAAALLAGYEDGGPAADRDRHLLRAVARHLVDFRTWRSLVQQDLHDREVVEIAVRLLNAARASSPDGDGGHRNRVT